MNSKADIREALATVQCPTLVVHRTGDLDAQVEEGRYLAEHIRGARFVELAGDDHVPFVDPDQILDEVQEFLTGVRPTRATGRPIVQNAAQQWRSNGGRAPGFPFQLPM